MNAKVIQGVEEAIQPPRLNCLQRPCFPILNALPVNAGRFGKLALAQACENAPRFKDSALVQHARFPSP